MMNMDRYGAQKFLIESFIAQCIYKVANIAPAPGPYTQHCSIGIQFAILEDLTSWKNI
jgi:hypothetical protein